VDRAPTADLLLLLLLLLPARLGLLRVTVSTIIHPYQQRLQQQQHMTSHESAVASWVVARPLTAACDHFHHLQISNTRPCWGRRCMPRCCPPGLTSHLPRLHCNRTGHPSADAPQLHHTL